MTGETGPEAMAAAVAKLGFENDQVVQEWGWDDDADDDFRFAVEDAVGTELEDEDFTGAADAAILWWRDEDGDLTDALVDTLGTLEDGGMIVLLTPRGDGDGAVDPADVEEAATTAGLHTSTTAMCGERWVATLLVARKSGR
ncbi:DUF3052 domain-containing protein [Janibacter sp. GXQ6167]|uniref:DUF3052 domain-containing protein n=1 Tax=Janibacter sp. GXQ6167 TaxID=3240791 RepID=UPI00352449A2